jgi:hypothetical protein
MYDNMVNSLEQTGYATSRKKSSAAKKAERMEANRKIIEQCDIVSAQLNPSIAKEREREDKMNTLENRMNSIEAVLSEMNRTLKDLAS